MDEVKRANSLTTSLQGPQQSIVQPGWLERQIKPKKISARYPFKGKVLLYTTCAFGSLGDGLHGYDSGERNRSIQLRSP